METIKNNTPKGLAVVTGASSGIGLELALQFAQNGFDLIIAAEDSGITQAASTISQTGVQVKAVQADLANFEGVEKLYAEIKAEGRPIEAIALNAGVGIGGDFARDTDLRTELNIINLNVVSTVHLAKRVVQDMVDIGHGRILFTSSVVSQMPSPLMAVYSASKAFVESFAMAIREELKDTGVTITALMPGPTETNFFHRAELENTKVGAAEKDSAALVARQGYEALMEGKDHVVAGSFMNKVQTTISKILPDPVKAKISEQQAKPASAKKSH